MGEFICRVADTRGHVSTQVETAGSVAEVRQRLSEKGLYVYSVRARTLTQWVLRQEEKRFRRIPPRDFLLLNQQFVTLIRAGLPILQSLELLARRTTQPALTAVLDAVRKRVRAGASLSEAMRETGVFTEVYTTSVLAGERSGDLAGTLEHYIAYQKMTGTVRRRLLAALIYPAVLIVASTAVLTFVILYVIPQFSLLYAESNVPLPWLTMVVLDFALQVRGEIGFLVLLVAAAAGGLYLAGRSETGARAIDRVRMEAPLVGEVIRKFRLAQFARTLATLLHGGIPLVAALETASGAMEGAVLRHAVTTVTQSVREGKALHTALAETGVFPELVTEMVEVGESTGALSAMLNSVAEFYEDELDAHLGTILALIQPVLLIVMAVVIGTILVALYLPIFSVGQVVR